MNNSSRTSTSADCKTGYSTPNKGLVINNNTQTRDDNEAISPESRHRYPYPAGVVGSGGGSGGNGVSVANYGVNNNGNANRENGQTTAAVAAAAQVLSPSKLRRRAHISNFGGNSNHGKVVVGDAGSSFGNGCSRPSDRSPVLAATRDDTVSLAGLIRQSSTRAATDVGVPDLEAAGSVGGGGGDSDGSFAEETAPPGGRRHNQLFPPTTKSESVPSRYFLAKPRAASAQVATEFSEPTRQRQRPTFRSRTTASAAALNAAAAAAAAAPIETYPIYTNSHVANISPLSPASQPLSQEDGRWWRLIVGCFATLRFWVLIQFIVIVTLATHVVAVEKKRAKVVEQIQIFEDEQANILTQMMWIDKAAKKITESSNRMPESNSAMETDYESNLHQSVLDLTREIQSMQTRIQENARIHIARKYNDIKESNDNNNNKNNNNEESTFALKSVQVMIHLQQEVNGLRDLKLDLWVNDTPHAAWMWLEQVNQTLWDGGQFQWVSQGTLVAVPKEPMPYMQSLEFLENPRRQNNQDCEVSLMQNKGRGFSLRINLLDDPNPTEQNVCIGRVVKGLENLQLPKSGEELRSQLPIGFIKIL